MNPESTMLDLAAEYLALRRKLGFQMRSEGNLLLSFGRYADQSGHKGPVTTELALRWAKLPKNATRINGARRLDVVRRYAKHRALFDSDTEIPPEGLLGPSYRRPPPYIYSEAEIAALLEASKDLRPRGGLRAHTYVTLFGLLACSGLRISEALRLTRRDVDLPNGILTIQKSKFHKSRLVPLHQSSLDPLSSYAAHRDHYLGGPIEAFFLTDRGTPLNQRTVNGTFDTLRNKLGWKKRKETGHPPRIHDLRHHVVNPNMWSCLSDFARIGPRVAICPHFVRR